MRPVPAAAVTLLTLLFFACLPAQAHEGHNHGETPAEVTVAATSVPRAAASSDEFEVVAIARADRLEIYVDKFATNEPVADAEIEVETPGGPVQATAMPDQAFRLDAPWLANLDSIDLVLTVTAGGVTEIFPLSLRLKPATAEPAGTQAGWIQKLLPVAIAVVVVGLIVVLARVLRPATTAASLVLCFAILFSSMTQPVRAHDGHDHGNITPEVEVKTGDTAQRLPDGRLFVPKAVQRIFALRAMLTETKPYRRRVELPGRIIPDPNASGFVQAAAGGRLAPPPNGFPRLGTVVKQGDILAYVTPPLQAIDISDMRQRRGEIDQQIAIMQDRLARFQTLIPSGAIARSQVEETKIELEGLKDRRAMLEKSQREPEALIAPVSGAIAEGSAVAGQIVQPSAVVFQIIDPERLWIEALSFESIGATAGAIATTSQGNTLELEFRGSGLADRSQSIPVHFAIRKNNASLRVGQFVNVVVPVDEERSGLTIPRASVVRAPGGGDMVFEHANAEIFTPRLVRIEPLDADNVLVSSGLEQGQRIVTQGAELLDHVR